MSGAVRPIGVVPDLPRDPQILEKDQRTGEFTGRMNTTWSLFFDQLVGSLQQVLSPEGFLMPQQSAANLDGPDGALYNDANFLGGIVYDITNNVPRVNVYDGSNYVWKTFTIS